VWEPRAPGLGHVFPTRLASSSSHFPSGVPGSALTEGWRRSARAATSASAGGTPPRSRCPHAKDACKTARFWASTRNWANLTLAEAVPPEAELGASSRGGTVRIDARRRPSGARGYGSTDPALGGALDGPLWGGMVTIALTVRTVRAVRHGFF
jgi:hypothetical protein